MSHTYVTLSEFKAVGAANITTTTEDAQLLESIESASRQVEGLLRRRLHPHIATRYFSGNAKSRLDLPGWDIISVTSLKEDANLDGTYEITWASSDYLLGPQEHDPTDFIDPKPYWQLQVDERSTGNQDVFLKGQRIYELTGKFGYCDLTLDSGATINEGGVFSSSDTTLTVSDGTAFSVGNTILIESEQLYVTAISTNDLTVRRGMNGSTSASHADSTAISKYVYPENLVKATILQASRLRIRNIGGYSHEVGLDATGVFTPQVGVDQDFWQLVERYKMPGII